MNEPKIYVAGSDSLPPSPAIYETIIRNDESDHDGLRGPVSGKHATTTTTTKNDYYRCGLFIVSCLYIFLFIGAFFGWGQMQLLLERHDHFSALCDHDHTGDASNNHENSVCNQQTNALIRVQLIAQTVQIFSPLFGYLVDTYGGKWGFYVLTANVWCGITMLVLCASLSSNNTASYYSDGISSNLRADRLLYVAFVLLSTAVSFGGISMIQTGVIFFDHPRTQQRVISTLNALFDAGAITYLILYELYDAFQISIVTIFSAYLGLAVVLLSAGIYFWNVAMPLDSLVTNTVHTENGMVEQLTTATSSSIVRSDEVVDLDPIPPNNKCGCQDDEEIEAHDANTGTGDGTELTKEISNHDMVPEAKTDTYILLAKRTRKQQLLSFPHLCLIIFTCIHFTSNQWTLATIRDFLASLGDDEYDNRYLTIFTLLTPASLLGLPMVDYVIHNYGYYTGLQCVNALGIGYMLVRLCSTDLNVQIIGFVIFAIFRCFLYSTFSNLIPILFSSDLVSFVIGILIGIPGITAFLNVPLAKYTIEYADGNFFVANLLYTILIIPSILVAYGIGRTIQNEKKVATSC